MGSTSFVWFSCPNMILVSLNLLFLGTCIIFFRKCWDFLRVFFFSFLFCTSVGLACDHGNSFLCLLEEEIEGSG